MTTNADHPSREVLERFLLAQLPASESRRVLRHLLTGCRDCQMNAGAAWKNTQPGSVMQGNFNSGVPGNHTLSALDVQAVNAVYGSPEPETWTLMGIGLALLAVTKLVRRGASAA